MSQDKRRFTRVEPEKGKPIVVDINGKNFVDVLNAQDISEGGLGISVPHGFEGCMLNEPVSLVVKLPQPISDSFMATGKIKHISSGNFGVTFLALSAEGRKKAKRYIQYRSGGNSWFSKIRNRLS